jgi:ribosomal protein L15
VKILGHGDAPQGLRFDVDAVSQSAREKIVEAGGEIIGAVVAAAKERKPKSGE